MNININKTILTITFLLLISCKESNQINPEKNTKLVDSTNVSSQVKNETNANDLCSDKLIYGPDENGFQFYYDSITRGDGVVSLEFNGVLRICNLDGTGYATIINTGDSSYDLNFPNKEITARNLSPIFNQFEFDAEKPSAANDFIKIYVNKEPKIIKKEGIDFGFSFTTWNEYISTSDFQLCNEPENLYQTVKIIDNNTVLAKTINSDCGEQFISKDKSEKVLKWRDNNYLKIRQNVCN